MLIAQIVNTVTQSGIGLGSVIAVVCSWDRNRSILWAILAGVFSWFYVIYFALTREEEDVKQKMTQQINEVLSDVGHRKHDE